MSNYPWSQCLEGCPLALHSKVYLLKCLHALCSKHEDVFGGADLSIDSVSSLPPITCSKCRIITQAKEVVVIVPEKTFVKKETAADVQLKCEYCVKRRPAEAFCAECPLLLCKSCGEVHREAIKTYTHVLSNDLEKQRVEEFNRRKHAPRQCKQHQQSAEFFCFDCDELICSHSGCARGHSKEEHKSIVIEEEKINIITTVNNIRDIVPKLDKAISTLLEKFEKVKTEEWLNFQLKVDEEVERNLKLLLERRNVLIKKGRLQCLEQLRTIKVRSKWLERIKDNALAYSNLFDTVNEDFDETSLFQFVDISGPWTRMLAANVVKLEANFDFITEKGKSFYSDKDLFNLILFPPEPVQEVTAVTAPNPVQEVRAITAPEPVQEVNAVTAPEPVQEVRAVTAPEPVPEVRAVTAPVTAPKPVQEIRAVTAPKPVQEVRAVTAPEPVQEVRAVTAPEPVQEVRVVTAPEPVHEVRATTEPEPTTEVRKHPNQEALKTLTSIASPPPPLILRRQQAVARKSEGGGGGFRLGMPGLRYLPVIRLSRLPLTMLSRNPHTTSNADKLSTSTKKASGYKVQLENADGKLAEIETEPLDSDDDEGREVATSASPSSRKASVEGNGAPTDKSSACNGKPSPSAGNLKPPSNENAGNSKGCCQWSLRKRKATSGGVDDTCKIKIKIGIPTASPSTSLPSTPKAKAKKAVFNPPSTPAIHKRRRSFVKLGTPVMTRGRSVAQSVKSLSTRTSSRIKGRYSEPIMKPSKKQTPVQSGSRNRKQKNYSDFVDPGTLPSLRSPAEDRRAQRRQLTQAVGSDTVTIKTNVFK